MGNMQNYIRLILNEIINQINDWCEYYVNIWKVFHVSHFTTLFETITIEIDVSQILQCDQWNNI